MFTTRSYTRHPARQKARPIFRRRYRKPVSIWMTQTKTAAVSVTPTSRSWVQII